MPHIAHLNRGVLIADWDAPEVAGFVDNILKVNAAAERSEGYVWRLLAPMTRAEGRALCAPGQDPDRVATTLSVWQTPEAFARFVHRTIHGQFLRRGAEWFEPATGPAYVMWQIAPGQRPTMAEGIARLQQLASDGAGPQAFDLEWLRAEGRLAAETG